MESAKVTWWSSVATLHMKQLHRALFLGWWQLRPTTVWPRFFDQVSPSLRPLKTLKAGLTIGTPKRGWDVEVGFFFPGEVCKVILQRPERGEALWLAIHPRGWIKVTWCFRVVDVKNVCFFWLLEMCDPARFVLRMEQPMWFLAENISFYPLCPTPVGHIGPFECVSAAFSLLPPVSVRLPAWAYCPARYSGVPSHLPSYPT